MTGEGFKPGWWLYKCNKLRCWTAIQVVENGTLAGLRPLKEHFAQLPDALLPDALGHKMAHVLGLRLYSQNIKQFRHLCLAQPPDNDAPTQVTDSISPRQELSLTKPATHLPP
jgi:hypothetical protein